MRMSKASFRFGAGTGNGGEPQMCRSTVGPNLECGWLNEMLNEIVNILRLETSTSFLMFHPTLSVKLVVSTG